jgi:cytochrome c oxidase subunit III
MAVATHSSTASQPAAHASGQAHTHVRHAPVTPGKVAMWLFLATEVMFFTGLIGSYIVLRAGSPPDAFSNFFPPASSLEGKKYAKGVILESAGADHEAVVKILEDSMVFDKMQTLELEHKHAAIDRLKLSPEEASKQKAEATAEFRHEQAEHLVHAVPVGVLFGVPAKQAAALHDRLDSAGAKTKIVPLATFNWPKPYDFMTNPLSIDLTALNTFFLICSSVTMVFALSAFQEDRRSRGTLFLLATALIGSLFLSIQVYEYYQLMMGHHYPPGISANGHFRPSVSLFASCFFTMTGFHGAHVFAGVVMLTCITINSAVTGSYTRTHYSPVELVGLYWHFVDLVWILLFTVVYLI